MDANPLVFDISSDDDPPSPPMRHDDNIFDLIRDIFDDFNGVEGEERRRLGGGDSDDEVVILGQSHNAPKPKLKQLEAKAVSDADGDDDDCVVLDGDPDGPAQVPADGGFSPVCNDEDDLLVVGQKGQVACRDYPHLRHLCIKFPFNSTSHDSHCELCYCYVCDAPAPCAQWGSSGSSDDHCHATDKLESWKTLREISKLGHIPSLAAPNSVSSGTVMTQINHIAPAANDFQPIRSSSQCVPIRPGPMRPCSSSSPYGTPSIMRHSRKQQSALPRRHVLVPPSISNQALRVHPVGKIHKSGLSRRHVLVSPAVPNQALRVDHVGEILQSGDSAHPRRNVLVSPGVPNQALRAHLNIISKGANPVGSLQRPPVSNSSASFNRSRIAESVVVKNRYVHSSHDRNHAPVSQHARHIASSSRDVNIGGQQNVLPGIVSESFGKPSDPVNGANAFGPGLSGMAVCQPNHNINPIGNQDQHYPVLNWLSGAYNQATTSGNCPLSDVCTSNEPPPAQLAVASQCGDWFPDPSLPVPSPECFIPSDMDAFAHDPSAFDPGMLYYDFETSWLGMV